MSSSTFRNPEALISQQDVSNLLEVRFQFAEKFPELTEGSQLAQWYEILASGRLAVQQRRAEDEATPHCLEIIPDDEGLALLDETLEAFQSNYNCVHLRMEVGMSYDRAVTDTSATRLFEIAQSAQPAEHQMRQRRLQRHLTGLYQAERKLHFQRFGQRLDTY